MARLRLHLAGLALVLGSGAAQAADDQAVIRTLDQRSCERCMLQDADLVHADLRDAQLQGAQLERANLSGARLDGADLRESNLRFTSLAGASLRGADLRGSVLEGTDLRNSDLSGARLDPGALEGSHWNGAKGIKINNLSINELTKAIEESWSTGDIATTEYLLDEVIYLEPNSAAAWSARGLIRAALGKNSQAAQDLRHAQSLYLATNQKQKADKLIKAISTAERDEAEVSHHRKANGAATALAASAGWAIKLLAPTLGIAWLSL